MPSFTTNKFGKVKFFRSALATPAFLEAHGVNYAGSQEELDVFLSQSMDGTPLLYVVQLTQLRAIDLATMDKLRESVQDLPPAERTAALAQNQVEQPYQQRGEQLYRGRYSTPDGRPSLSDAAQGAAVAAGLRPTAADWFKSFVEDTFFGWASWQEFTEHGVRRPRRSLGGRPSTVQYQLNQLQRRDIMRYEVLPKGDGLYLRFNRQFLPGLDFDKLPLFFDTFLY